MELTGLPPEELEGRIEEVRARMRPVEAELAALRALQEKTAKAHGTSAVSE